MENDEDETNIGRDEDYIGDGEDDYKDQGYDLEY